MKKFLKALILMLAIGTALTGCGGQQDRQKTTDAGFDAHLVKPVTEFDLFQAIATVRAPAPGAALID